MYMYEWQIYYLRQIENLFVGELGSFNYFSMLLQLSILLVLLAYEHYINCRRQQSGES